MKPTIPTYSLSVAALIFINPLIHIGGAVWVKRYAAGLVSAVFLYIPLSVYAYFLYSQAGLLDPSVFFLSLSLGVGWMGLAVAFGLASGRSAKAPERCPLEEKMWDEVRRCWLIA